MDELLVRAKHPQYASLQSRLDSFKCQCYNTEWKPSARELAEAGFFWTCKYHSLTCFACSNYYLHIEDDEDAWMQHARVCRSCPYLVLKRGSDFIAESILKRLDLFDRLYIKHRLYMCFDRRLASFKRSESAITLPTAIDLADAGFFYSRQDNGTLCFACGGGLRDWDGSENVWLEHARHFPKCRYVISRKGTDFVSQCCKLHVSLSKQQNGSTSSMTSVHTGPECVICRTGKINVLFLPCKHSSVCTGCVDKLGNTCCICRGEIESAITIYIS